MKILRFLLCIIFTLPLTAIASNESIDHAHNADTHEAPTTDSVIELHLSPSIILTAGKTVKITATLIDKKTGKSLTENDIEVAHTQKFHLLVVDPTLTDYQHIHPTVSKMGEWVFNFTPLKNGNYRAWANIIPTATGKAEYVSADIGIPDSETPLINKTNSLVSAVGDYTFTLALDEAPKAGGMVMANITVTQNGKPFTQLEPVMGAFAHVVGFNEDYKTVIHIHPLGKEPGNADMRGGPQLDFHMEFEKLGFVKLFAQVRVDGKNIFAPFGITVK